MARTRQTRTIAERMAERATDMAVSELRDKVALLRSTEEVDPAALALFFFGVAERIATGELADPVLYAQVATEAGAPPDAEEPADAE